MNKKAEAIVGLRELVRALRGYTAVLKAEHPAAKIQCCVAAYNADGTGEVGPAWDYEVFLADLVIVVGEPDEIPNLSEPRPGQYTPTSHALHLDAPTLFPRGEYVIYIRSSDVDRFDADVSVPVFVCSAAGTFHEFHPQEINH